MNDYCSFLVGYKKYEKVWTVWKLIYFSNAKWKSIKIIPLCNFFFSRMCGFGIITSHKPFNTLQLIYLNFAVLTFPDTCTSAPAGCTLHSLSAARSGRWRSKPTTNHRFVVWAASSSTHAVVADLVVVVVCTTNQLPPVNTYLSLSLIHFLFVSASYNSTTLHIGDTHV